MGVQRYQVLVAWVPAHSRMDFDRTRPRDFSEVEVLATSATEASLIATQMVAGRPGPGGEEIEPVRTWVEGPMVSHGVLV